ncbi:MAG TPA: carbohydrate-binding protein, partial [Pyrinomonadaceae bacterium]|nr:carbohydrate-binding protein [Pyrinomonadaceae bacterium]
MLHTRRVFTAFVRTVCFILCYAVACPLPLFARTAAATTPSKPASAPAALPQGGQSPYGGTPIPVPGIIQAENFDEGGEGVAYHDTTAGNANGSVYRSTDVDMWEDDGRILVNSTAGGEWLEYTINVSANGTYSLLTQLWAYSDGGSFHIEIDGVDVTGTLSIPNTGWGNWDTVTKTGVQLTA